ncbi:hypothetical protein BMD79_001473 [Shigella sonnei]|nr:hypothetical protein [Shigella sonnei]EFZ4082076.1 hypothetical protein [Shigella sonnei]
MKILLTIFIYLLTAFQSANAGGIPYIFNQKILQGKVIRVLDGDTIEICIISKISSYSGFAVTAFLRIKEWDIATNILNREGIFAFNGCERRFRQLVSEDNWQQAVSEERAIRCAKRLIQCKG